MMLLDSNIIIYSFRPEYAFLQAFILQHTPAVSAISYVEVAGYVRLTSEALGRIDRFFDDSPIVSVDMHIIRRAAALRQMRKMSLGDAVIAATALIEGRTLITRNTRDFQWIEGLSLLDPFVEPI